MSFLDDIKKNVKRLSQSKMNARDAVQGSMGDAYVTIAGVRNHLGNMVKFEGKDSITEKKIGILGRPAKGTKMTNVDGTYTAVLYYNSSTMKEVVYIFRSTGYMPEIEFYIANDDPTSAAGRNSDVYRGCTIKEIITGQIDVDADVLMQNISGSYDEWEPVERFRPIQGTAN